MSETLKYKKLYSCAYDLVRATSKSVGFDIKSIEDVDLLCWNKAIIKTGIQVQPPEGTYIRVASRSGLAVRGITVEGGVIDPDFTGEIKVILYNHSPNDAQVKCGMRIAQLVTEKVAFPSILQVDTFNESSERGENGFGSSGL